MKDLISTGIIRTARLDLVPLPLDVAAAIVSGSRPAGVRWALGYPTEGTLLAAGMVVTANSEGRPLGTFGSYQMLHRELNLVVGDCGFEGPPDANGDVRVIFATSPSQGRRGFASEALQGLIAWVLGQPGVRRVVADTARTNQVSRRVLEGAGMRRARSDESLVYYEA